MKNIFLLSLLLIFSFGCDKDNEPLLFVAMPAVEFDVFTTFSPFDLHILPGNNGVRIPLNIREQIISNGIDISEVTSVIPGRAELTVNFNNESLEFIRACSVRICDQIESNGVCNQEIFYRDPMPDRPGFSEPLVPSAVGDISDLLYRDDIFVQFILEEMWSTPPANLVLRVDMQFEVR